MCTGVSALVTAALIAVLPPAASGSGEIHASWSMDPADLQACEGVWGDYFTLPGAAGCARPGDPLLPAVPLYLALPAGAVVESVEVTDLIESELPGTFRVQPAQRGVPLSRPEDFVYTPPVGRGYLAGGEDMYPVVSLAGQGTLMGHDVADLLLRPLTWNPATGVATVRHRVDFVLCYSQGPGSGSMPGIPSARSESGERICSSMVRGLVMNPWDVGPSGACVVPAGDLPWGEYLIITSEALSSAFEPLAEAKTIKGVPARIVTVEYIEDNYTGVDQPARIRHFLRDIYEDSPPTFILMGGDVDQVDARNCWATAEGYTGDPAADLYFQDMNDTAPGADAWDYDNDGVWGEIPDDIMDYHPDYLIGRAPASNTSEAGIFVDKVAAFEIADVDARDTDPWQNSMGFTTGILWSSPYCPGCAGKLKIDTLYTPPEWQPIVALYEHFGTQSYSGTMAMLNRGMQLVNHAGHGSNGSVSIGTGYLDISDFMSLTNISGHGRVSIWNTIACNSGGFDQGDCLGEAWVNSPGGGGFCMMNTRYGWGEPADPGNQWSELVDQQFFLEFLVNDVYLLGEAHAVAKDQFVSLIPSDTHYDWILKELTLFGDPELPMWNAPPDGDLAIDAPAEIGLGSQLVGIAVSDASGFLEDARVCLMQGDWESPNVYEVGYTDASGSVSFTIDTQEPGVLLATGWIRNHAVETVEITVTELGVSMEESPSGPRSYLGPPVPNPASGPVTLEFGSSSGNAELLVLDLHGRLVRRLGREMTGTGILTWDTLDDDGRQVPSGIYIFRLIDGGETSGRRAVVIR